MTTGEKIAALRREAGLSQEALADKLGISRQAVSKWEADQAVPGMDNLMELSRIFGVSVDTLLRPDGVLPGKEDSAEERSSEDTEKVVLSPSGYTVSYKPELTKRTKAFVIVVALLLCASVVCSIISLVWLVRLQQEVNLIPRGGNTVYVPTPDTTAEPGDMADVDIGYGLDPDDTTQLLFQVSAMPREIDSEEAAEFCFKGGGQTMTVDTACENGNYSCEASFPLADDVSIYLLLTKGGATRTLLVTDLYDLNREFGLDVYMEFEEGRGGLSWSTGQGSRLAGRLVVQVAGHSDPAKIYPVSGRVVVYVDGREYDSVPIYDIADRVDEWFEPGMGLATMYYYVDLPWEKIDADIDSITWAVELTDNLGRVLKYDY